MKHLDNEKGFTLAELLIALAILAVGLLGLAGMQVSAMTSNQRANRLTGMNAVAQRVMEDYMARAPEAACFNSSSSGDYAIDSGNSDGDGNSSTLKLDGAGTLRATYSIVPAGDRARITVVVTSTMSSDAQAVWQTRTVRLTCYKIIS